MKRYLPALAFIFVSFSHAVCLAAALDTWYVRKTNASLDRIVFGNGSFLATDNSGVTLLLSTNGIHWQQYLPPFSSAISQRAFLYFINGDFILIYAAGTADSQLVSHLFQSTNGMHWTKRFTTLPARDSGCYNCPFGPLSQVVYGNGTYVGVGDNIYTAPNPSAWSLVSEGVGSALGSAIAFGNGVFLSSCQGYASTDGMVWELRPLHPGCFGTIKFNQGRFVMVRTENYNPPTNTVSWPRAYVSLDGLFWSTAWITNTNSANSPLPISTLHSAGGHFFLSSATAIPEFLASTNGFDWDTHSFQTRAIVRDFAFGHGTYVVAALLADLGGYSIIQSAPVAPSPPPAVPGLDIQSLPALSITGTVGAYYQVEYTVNLANTNSFQPLATVQLPTSPYVWADHTALGQPHRFYRVTANTNSP